MDSDEFAEKVKAKLMPSIERMMREIIKQEVANLVSEAIRSELRSWLNDSNCDSICIPGYSFIATSRSEKRGGRVGFFIHQDIVFSSIKHHFGAATFENMFVNLKLRNTTITLGVVYRPPKSNLQLFNIEFLIKLLKVTLDQIRKNGDCVLLGDFNLDVTSDSTSVQEFLTTLSSHCLHPKIDQPTRITSKSATVIDNIFTNVFDRNSFSKIIVDDISDHLPIYFSFSAGVLNYSSSISSPIRLHTEEGIARFTEEIEGMDWSDILGYCRTLEVSKANQSFIIVYSEVYDRCFPIAPHRTKHYRFKNPGWLRDS